MEGEERSLSKATLVALIVACLLLMGGLIAAIVWGLNRDDIGLRKDRYGYPIVDPLAGPAVPGPDDYWWRAGYGEYKYAAVAADNPECSSLGTRAMARHGGTPVDAAILTMFCLGVVNPVANGIGGGMLMTVYAKPNNVSRRADREAWVFNARETAPAAAKQDMFSGAGHPDSVRGGKAIAVPGEVIGMYEAWKKFGRIPWSHLVEPAIILANDGFVVSHYLAEFCELNKEAIQNRSNMAEVFMKNGSPLKEGDTAYWPKLAVTLQKIADNPMAFYDPDDQLAQDIVADIQEAGGIITTNDLRDYKVIVKPPLRIKIDDKLTMITVPPPSSGIIVGTILKVLSEFNFTSESVGTVGKAIETYQRIVETFKLAYAERSKLGDSDFVNNTQLLDDLLSDAGIERMRSRINESSTQPLDYYQASYSDPNDLGTNHLSVYGGHKEAVALTSSINYDFGSMVLGSRTGILFNDHMDDFGIPGQVDSWGFPTAPNNLIEPGKRPMSSMSPSIILNDDNGEVLLVTGGTGGSKIITTVALSIIKALWFGWDAKQVVDDPRIHHQLIPHKIEKEEGFSKAVLYGLKQKGHEINKEDISGIFLTTNQIIKNTCGLCSENDTKCRDVCRVQAASDGRRFATPDGF